MSVHLDITELVKAPLRTGIQRVEREIIRHWPGERPTPVIVDSEGRFKSLPSETLDFLIEEGVDVRLSRAEETMRLAEYADAGTIRKDRSLGTLLNLELFFDPVRAAAHRRLVANRVKVAWYVHDFIPYLQPGYFGQGAARWGMHYIRALRDVADRLSFNSLASREDCAFRVLRRPQGNQLWPVFPCGADGLRLERQSFNPRRRRFVSVGSIERRKNTMALLLAFERLWTEGVDAELVLIGSLRVEEVVAREFIERNAGNPRFEFLSEAPDEVLRDRLRSARALVMPSEVEGFGLPPFEAVYCGIPAIMSSLVPTADLIPKGAIKLERADPASIADAVKSMLDDDVATRMWEEAANVELPTWQTVTEQLASWAKRL